MTSAKRDQSILLHINESFKNARVPLPKLRKLVQIVCDRFRGDKIPDRKYEIHIAIVDDIQIRQLSGQFLRREETTDCLSFDLTDGDEEEPQAGKPASSVFEIIVNGEMAARQATLRGHSSEAELALYITHGLLHHFGFDDATPGRARIMHDAEDEILQQIGYGCVYNRDIRAQKQ
jgi:probable rRNA maturation factor